VSLLPGARAAFGALRYEGKTPLA